MLPGSDGRKRFLGRFPLLPSRSLGVLCLIQRRLNEFLMDSRPSRRARRPPPGGARPPQREAALAPTGSACLGGRLAPSPAAVLLAAAGKVPPLSHLLADSKVPREGALDRPGRKPRTPALPAPKHRREAAQGLAAGPEGRGRPGFPHLRGGRRASDRSSGAGGAGAGGRWGGCRGSGPGKACGGRGVLFAFAVRLWRSGRESACVRRPRRRGDPEGRAGPGRAAAEPASFRGLGHASAVAAGM